MPNPSPRPLRQALALAFNLGWTIVVPLVFFAVAGRFADRHYGTSPWLLLAGMATAILLTTILLVRKFSHLLRDLNQPPTNP